MRRSKDSAASVYPTLRLPTRPSVSVCFPLKCCFFQKVKCSRPPQPINQLVAVHPTWREYQGAIGALQLQQARPLFAALDELGNTNLITFSVFFFLHCLLFLWLQERNLRVPITLNAPHLAAICFNFRLLESQYPN